MNRGCLKLVKDQSMISIIRDDKGIALVTSLMLTLITMTIISALFYVMTQSVQMSGANKRYKTVLQAAYGASDIVSKDILKKIFDGYSSPTALASQYPSLAGFSADPCLRSKVNNNTADWPATCSSNFAANIQPDVTFLLQATSNQPFRVFAKVVDTSKGNTDKSDVSTLRETHNVTDSFAAAGETIPNTFRIEVQSERDQNPQERAKLSVLYAY